MSPVSGPGGALPMAPIGLRTCAGGAPRSPLANTLADAAPLTIVSHHKTGTFAAFMLTGACMRCPVMKDDKWWARGEVKTDTWRERCANRSSTSFDTAMKDCAVQLCQDGLGHERASCPVSGSRRKSMRDRSVVHFIRHPVDAIVSAYLYHMECHESAARPPRLGRWAPEWLYVTNAEVVSDMRQVLGAHDDSDRRSYCQLLQQNNATMGIEAEVMRSLAAYNGVSGLLRDFQTLHSMRENGNGKVEQICLTDVTPGFPGAEERWHELTTRLGCEHIDSSVDETMMNSHGTTVVKTKREDLRELAMRALDARITEDQRHALDALEGLCPLEKWKKNDKRFDRLKVLDAPSAADRFDSWSALDARA